MLARWNLLQALSFSVNLEVGRYGIVNNFVETTQPAKASDGNMLLSTLTRLKAFTKECNASKPSHRLPYLNSACSITVRQSTNGEIYLRTSMNGARHEKRWLRLGGPRSAAENAGFVLSSTHNRFLELVATDEYKSCSSVLLSLQARGDSHWSCLLQSVILLNLLSSHLLPSISIS